MSRNALILVDFQNDYFEGGTFPLVAPLAAVTNARRVLDDFRSKGDCVIHVRHHATEPNATFFVPATWGAEIHPLVSPRGDEPVLTKSNINAFLDTGLKDLLEERSITNVVVAGAMSHMCIDAVVRAASDFGFSPSVVQDAVATKDMEFGGRLVPAVDVHASFMAALAFAYAEVISTDDYLGR